MVSQSMHEIRACKPRTVQPFLVAVLVCRRFYQAPLLRWKVMKKSYKRL